MNGNNFDNGNEFVFQNVMDVKSRNRGLAIASMVLGIFSIVCCCLSYVGLAAAVLAIVFAVISRVRMGYFDGLAVAGLVTGIIGAVFGIAIIIVDLFFVEIFEAYLAEYYPDINTEMV